MKITILNILTAIFITIGIVITTKKVADVLSITFSYILQKRKLKKLNIIEKNPKWIVSDLKTRGYGLDDVDVFVTENTDSSLHTFDYNASQSKLTAYVPKSFSSQDIEVLAKEILVTKIYIKTKNNYDDKPIHWLFILYYLLEGNDISPNSINWNILQKRQ